MKKRMLLLMLGILGFISIAQAQDKDQLYEQHVQNRLMDNFDWDVESNADPFAALNNIEQFGEDFQVKEVFEKGEGCFYGDPWNNPTFRFVRDFFPSLEMYGAIREPLNKLRAWLHNPLFAMWYVYYRAGRALPSGSTLGDRLEAELRTAAISPAFRNSIFELIYRDDQTPTWAKLFITLGAGWPDFLAMDEMVGISEDRFYLKSYLPSHAARRSVIHTLREEFGLLEEADDGSAHISVMEEIHRRISEDLAAYERGQPIQFWKILAENPEWPSAQFFMKSFEEDRNAQQAKQKFLETLMGFARTFLKENPVINNSFQSTYTPVLAVSESQDFVTLDFQEKCLHPKFREQAASVYSDKGCVCQVKIPKALLNVSLNSLAGNGVVQALRRPSHGLDQRLSGLDLAAGTSTQPQLPIKFTLYRWGYAHYTDVKSIPVDKRQDILAELRILRHILNQTFGLATDALERRAAIGRPRRSGESSADLPSFELPQVLFGPYGKDAALHW